jgi:hypothetical protein
MNITYGLVAATLTFILKNMDGGYHKKNCKILKPWKNLIIDLYGILVVFDILTKG